MKQKKSFSNQKIIFLVFMFIMASNVVFGTVYQVGTVFKYKVEISELKDEIKQVKDEKDKIIKDSNYGEKDLEEIARDEFNMVKPNDIVYMDIGDEGN